MVLEVQGEVVLEVYIIILPIRSQLQLHTQLLLVEVDQLDHQDQNQLPLEVEVQIPHLVQHQRLVEVIHQQDQEVLVAVVLESMDLQVVELQLQDKEIMVVLLQVEVVEVEVLVLQEHRLLDVGHKQIMVGQVALD